MHVESGEAMGTFLQVRSENEIPCDVSLHIRKIFGDIESVCSRFLKESEISRINENSGICSVKVSQTCMKIIKKSMQVAEFTNGVFDPSIGAMSSLWNIGSESEYVPTEKEIQKAWSLVDYRNILIDGNSVFLENKGMSLDLGGIAKEYAIHQAANFCRKKKLEGIIIDCGGDISTVGKKPDGSDWRIGIQHPRRRNNLIASVVLASWNTVETSGDYRRFIKKDDLFQSHIFSVNNEKRVPLSSATLVYDGNYDFPLTSSALLAGGLDFSKRMLKKCKGMEAILITDKFEVFVTKNLYDYCNVISDNSEKILLDL